MDLIPSDLGARIKSAARARRTPGYSIESGETSVDGAVVYEEVSDIVLAALRDLPHEGWAQPVQPYPWSVHDLLSHLLAAERYTAAQLGVPGVAGLPDPEDDDHLTFADPTIATERTRPPADTLADWWEMVSQVRAVARPGTLPERPTSFHGLPMDASALLVLRGFELWIHSEDIARATDTPVAIPSAPAVRSMAELSVATLVPLALRLAPQARASEVRVVLTGAGGGTWNLTPDDGREESLLVMDVVDYCRYAARRLGRAELRVDIEGDVELAENLLDASRRFAV